jgi:hypothetical protein
MLAFDKRAAATRADVDDATMLVGIAICDIKHIKRTIS